MGVASSVVHDGEHFNEPGEIAWYVDFEWREVTALEDRIRTEDLLRAVPNVPWNDLYGSGAKGNVIESDAQCGTTTCRGDS